MLYTINFLIFKLFRAKKNHENALDLFVLFSFPWRLCCCMVDAEWSTAWSTPLLSGRTFRSVKQPIILWNFTCV